MNYVDSVKTRAYFLNIGYKKQKPAYADYSYNGYDHGYDLYQTLENNRKYVKSNDFGFKASLLMKKGR